MIPSPIIALAENENKEMYVEHGVRRVFVALRSQLSVDGESERVQVLLVVHQKHGKELIAGHVFANVVPVVIACNFFINKRFQRATSSGILCLRELHRKILI